MAIFSIFIGLFYGLGYPGDKESGAASGFLLCNHGYDLIKGKCIDIDECTMGLHDCGANEICENSHGGFTCKCAEGQEREHHVIYCISIMADDGQSADCKLMNS